MVDAPCPEETKTEVFFFGYFICEAVKHMNLQFFEWDFKNCQDQLNFFSLHTDLPLKRMSNLKLSNEP